MDAGMKTPQAADGGARAAANPAKDGAGAKAASGPAVVNPASDSKKASAAAAAADAGKVRSSLPSAPRGTC